MSDVTVVFAQYIEKRAMEMNSCPQNADVY